MSADRSFSFSSLVSVSVVVASSPSVAAVYVVTSSLLFVVVVVSSLLLLSVAAVVVASLSVASLFFHTGNIWIHRPQKGTNARLLLVLLLCLWLLLGCYRLLHYCLLLRLLHCCWLLCYCGLLRC